MTDYIYRIFETQPYLDDLKNNVEKRGRKIRPKLDEYIYLQLKQNPYYGKNIKRLRGITPELWRYRVSDFRLFYDIDEKEKIVVMLTADYRKDSY